MNELALQSKKILLSVRFDDVDVVLVLGSDQKVLDALRMACHGFRLQDRPEDCHLSRFGQLYLPDQLLAATDLDPEDVLYLRVPI